jgi:hypothetical protein
MILQHTQWSPLLPVPTNHIPQKFVLTSSTGTGAIVGRQITTVLNNSSHSSLGNEDLSNGLTEPPIGPHHERSPQFCEAQMNVADTHSQAHWQKFSSLSGRACYHQAELFLYLPWNPTFKGEFKVHGVSTSVVQLSSLVRL